MSTTRRVPSWVITRDEYLKLRLADTQAELSEQELRQVVNRLDETKGGARFENRHRCRNGDVLDIEIHARMLDMGEQRLLVGIWHDITERKRNEAAMVAREREFRTLAENTPDNIARHDSNARLLYINPALERTLGRRRDELLGKIPQEVAPGDIYANYQQTILQVAATGESASFELVHPDEQGLPSRVHLIKAVAEPGSGNKRNVLAVGRDITDLKRAEENMRLLASIFETCQEAILVTNADNIIVVVNPAFSRITGYRRDEVLGKNPKILSSGRQDKVFYAHMWQAIKTKMEWRGEVWNRRKSGEVYAELLSIAVISDERGRALRHVGVFSDITALKSHEAELNQIANYDALTALPNRRLLTDRLQQAIARAQRSSKVLAVCYLDLDGFKQVNDRFGHEAGDQLLVDMTYRLQAALRAEDTLARLGGDEFVILLGDLADEHDYFPVLDRMLAIVAAPVIRDGREMTVSASIGVTFYPHDNEDGDTLLRHADQAMYAAKQTGKRRYQVYDAGHDQRLRRVYEFKLEIERGLNEGEFELYYQPKMELASGRILAVEALIRWRHPERGLLLPADFLPVIENSELEIRLGAWVIDAALAQLAVWQETGIDLGVSINISARHLQSEDFVSGLELTLSRYPSVPRDKLQIEILETAALEDFDLSTETIQACRKLGVDFALDDFGTGYSSLAYLRRLPADTLKIDASFIRNLLEDSGDQAIVQGVIALAKAFNRSTVAEGVEVPELIPILINIGCTHAQGYGIAYPMPVEELLLWLNERVSRI
ncbi:EAL domain-containing protein [Candidatus Methylospira mobilis]|uniref:sensor domain-containing protein n=1 Tax=Candidatus Methylospira mobilis TaxID=1808979 RepID=UPI0028E49BFB|nr:EAL domain-containing protein [Candidatus Methylospira mobilis]WNV05017.1 EAL domain-containing protein [Candidatus Methylospira mobilis]